MPSFLLGSWAFFLVIKLGLWAESTYKESITDILNLFIALASVFVALFREEIRAFLFKPRK
ncbi:hypothetical protein A0044_08085 [Campylobacter upsaliensis]|nr:hypothetical protein [Campylobacter upsaliensis]